VSDINWPCDAHEGGCDGNAERIILTYYHHGRLWWEGVWNTASSASGSLARGYQSIEVQVSFGYKYIARSEHDVIR